MRPTVDRGHTILIGDIQSPLTLEYLLGRKNHCAERARIFREVASAFPKRVVFLGDLVAKPSSGYWGKVDELVAPLKEQGTELISVAGNHDLWFDVNRGYQELRTRGLILDTSWRSLQVGNTKWFLLDSNLRALGPKKTLAQWRWLKTEVDAAESDAAVRSIYFLSHHPPFTNCRIVRGSAKRLATPLSIFFEAQKTRGWLSGHVHAYERFTVRDKTFVVCGSSSASRMGLLPHTFRKHVDVSNVASPSPFCWMAFSDGGWRTFGFQTMGDAPTVLDSF